MLECCEPYENVQENEAAGQFYPDVLGNGRAQIWRAECIETMSAMDDDCVDHVIADPPYEDHMHSAKTDHPRGRKIRQDGYADIPAVNFASIDAIRQEAATQMVRVSSGWLIVFCTPEGVAAWRDAIEAAGAKYKRACFWDKPDGAPQFNGQGPAMPGENFVCAWCGSGYSKWNAGGKRGKWTHPTNPRDRDGRHPTEKPVSLMRELARDFTQAGQLILDPFMGSGSTGIAALIEGRRFAGIEKDQGWFEVATQRLGWLIDRKGPMQQRAERAAGEGTAAGGEADLLSGVL